jgi:hypothetical protein
MVWPAGSVVPASRAHLGRPRPRSAIMFRMISELPPAMVKARA